MKGLCHKCFRSNSSVTVINGITTCLKCNREYNGKTVIRKCADCKTSINFKESGKGTQVRCVHCQKERRRIMQNENNRKNYAIKTNK